MYQNIFISDSPGQSSTIHLWDDELGLQTFPYSKFRYAFTPHPEGEFTSMYGDKLKKVFKYDINNKAVRLFESDVSRETRVLTDLYLESDEPSKNHRIVFFDIEVSSKGGFPNIEQADKEVTAVTLYSVQFDRFITLILDPEGYTRGYFPQADEKIIWCETERELLETYLEVWEKLNPTIISGWNSDGFDVPYMVRRITKILGAEEAARLSSVHLLKFNEFRGRFQIAGISSLDYMKLYKKYNPKQQPSYRLQDIAMDEIKEGKVDYEGSLETLYQEDRLTFLKYSIQDVRVLKKLDLKLRYIELVMSICHASHVQYEDFQYSSKFIEGTILTYLHRKNIIAPNKPDGGREAFEKKMEDDEEGFDGAFVKPPLPGLYEYVYSLDLQSLYPSIIMSLNISPETKIGKIHNWDINAFLAHEIDEYEIEQDGVSRRVPRSFIQNLIDTKPIHISAPGIIYRSDKKGIIPEILEIWFARRKEYKALASKYRKEGNAELDAYYDRLQNVQKIFLNSIYGVLGLSIFRFYDLDNALSVTASGQHVIINSSDFISKQYSNLGVPKLDNTTVQNYIPVLQEAVKKGQLDESAYRWLKGRDDDYCIYIDTDSVYFSVKPFFGPNDTEEMKLQKSIQIARTMESSLNQYYDDLAKRLFNCKTHKFVIKGETISVTALWVIKKRYALQPIYDLEKSEMVDVNKPPKVKGMDIVRSSFPPAFRNLMKEILADILAKKGKDYIDKKVLEFVDRIDEIPYKNLARNTSVKDINKYYIPENQHINDFAPKTPMHVKSALIFNRLLKKWGVEKIYNPIRNGDKVKYVYLKPNDQNVEVVCFRTYDDPPQITHLVENFIDRQKLIEAELDNKLQKFYDALNWGDIPTNINQTALELLEEI